MVITVPAQKQPAKRVRPINLNKDIPQVVALLELVFGEKIDDGGQRIFSHGPVRHPAILWRLTPGMNQLSPGFVWEENGRIIGNATLLSTQSPGRYIVVNVAVHPDYRRRGIARTLMEAIIDLVKARNGRVIVLQVVKDNTAAVRLYDSLNFTRIGNVTSWYSSISRVREIPPALHEKNEPFIRELGKQEWRAAYWLDHAALHPDLNWPQPLSPDIYKTGLWQRLQNFLNGRSVETWVIAGPDRLAGLAKIVGEWGRVHHASVRVHPDYKGQLERPLLAKIIRRLRYLPRRNVRIDHPDNDLIMTQLLREANFHPRRTLTHMRLEVT